MSWPNWLNWKQASTAHRGDGAGRRDGGEGEQKGRRGDRRRAYSVSPLLHVSPSPCLPFSPSPLLSPQSLVDSYFVRFATSSGLNQLPIAGLFDSSCCWTSD